MAQGVSWYVLLSIHCVVLLRMPIREAATIDNTHCYNPPIVDNTFRPIIGRVPLGNYVNYTCKEHFYAFGITTALCIKRNLKPSWIGPDMICEKMCGKPPDSVKAYPVDSTKNYYPPYTVILYRCKYGRMTLGSAATVCRSGKWKAASFLCIRMCGTPTTVKNAEYTASSPDQKEFREKSKVVYKCNKGYNQGGIDVAWCFRGKWRGPHIKCTVNRDKLNEMCGNPSEIENGQARVFDVPMRRVIYSCADGMELNGSAIQSCQPDGSWDNEPPTCVLKKNFCGLPPVIMEARHNASLERPAFKDRDALLYSCIRGFFHVGSPLAKCNGAIASWQDLTMECRPMRCSHPGEISGGRIEGSEYTYMSRIFFHCDVGHKLIGQRFRVCKDDGNWDGPISTCQRQECPLLEKPANGATFGGNKYGHVTKYVCYSGYKLVGDAERQCTENLTWTGSEPKCEPFHCPTLTPPSDGNIKVEYSVNSIANYSCEIGFELQGPVSRRCRSDETWTGFEPKCVEVGCVEPEPLWLGSISASSHKSGAIIFFSCNLGTTFVGKAGSAICLSSRWSIPTPKCYASCTVPDIEGLTAFKQDFLTRVKLKAFDIVEHDASTIYSCPPGFKPSVPRSVWCSNGTWSPNIECIVDYSKMCELPPDPANGFVQFENEPGPDGIDPGNIAIFTCQSGFSLLGKSKIRCGDDGRWEKDIPRCVFFHPGLIKQCEDLEHPENGFREVSSSSFDVNTTITFFCKPGYSLYGSKVVTCLSEYKWSNSKPICISFANG